MPQRVAYAVLRPVMRILHFRTGLRMRQLPQPVDAPHAHAPGVDPDRVLLFGSGPAMGYGVLSNELALPGHVARQLSAITARGVDLDVVSDTNVTIENARSLLSAVNLWRYDAILVTVGINDALLLTPVASWRDRVADLLHYVAGHVPKRTRVIIVAIPPIRTIDSTTSLSGWIADRHGIVLNRETRRIVQNFPGFTYVPFSPLARVAEAGYRSTETYEQWATLIVAPLGRELGPEPRSDEDRAMPVDEVRRQAALDAIGILDTPREERFDRIATLATQLLEAEFSAVLFVDRERHWIKAGENIGAITVQREGSFGAATISHGGLLVVPDARLDPRFSHNPHVVGEPHVVFYAGYPIETAFGEQIGVLSVYGTTTRDWDDEDAGILRELALMVQRELEAETEQDMEAGEIA